MTSDEILEIFKEKQALLEGHFELASKKHSPNYLQCAKILQYPLLAQKFCQLMAVEYQEDHIDVVAGPAIGGIIIAYELARALKTRAIYAERKQESLEFRRGFELKANERVLLVEDVITTGGSIIELADLCKKEGAFIAGCASFIDRRDEIKAQEKFPYDLKSLVKIKIPAYAKDQCPLCRNSVPIVKPGSQKLLKRP